ncbi:response regulator transcription factor [Amycolatopsis rhabdoformis]|uniref:Response regulator transcription factor n=1 Tax=Amycolatopsis rhabdoformis TaxID=1448059 RepID=A0ABZ1HZW5_9PSEU|nr:response regulator transcription factor [Amycolatopsis rhabdoformis]WSE27673.1 response regulator transcription factor [Amycolatopsis rhabdoformis]
MIRFCVVDDHEVIHDGLRAMADREPDLEFLGGATTVTDGEQLVDTVQPAVAILDLRIGERDGGNGIDLCRVFTGRYPKLSVVLFSAYGNGELLAQAIDAGAAGYMLKETSVSRVPAILREITTSGSWFEPRIASELLHRRSHGASSTPAFSARELDIVRGISRGENNHEIGEQLHISPHTVKYHIASLLRRHDVHRRAELVRLASDLHLLD